MKSDFVLNLATLLNSDIKDFLKTVSYDKNLCLDVMEVLSPTDRLIKSELESIANKLDSIRISLNYLNQPIVDEGVLKLSQNGRYSLNEYEYTCGNTIEFLMADPEDNDKWELARVEATNSEYYIYGFKKVKMNGLTVRRRERNGFYYY